MRRVLASILALGLLIAPGAPAGAAAARRHHQHQPGFARSDIFRSSHDEAVPHEAVPPGWYKFPGYPPIPPEENRNLDPSNFGGG
jgi:hypothetical protein